MSVNGVREQLQAGADLLSSLLDNPHQYNFYAALVHRRIVKVQLSQLNKKKIQFAGKKYPIQLLRCGEPISTLRAR